MIGPTNVNGGTLILGSPSALGQGTLRLTAGTIESTIPISLTNPITMNNSQLTFAGNNPITIGAPISQARLGNDTIVQNTPQNFPISYGGYGYSTPPPSRSMAAPTVLTAIVSNGVITSLVNTNTQSDTGIQQVRVTTPNAIITLTGNVSITSNNVGGVLFYGPINGSRQPDHDGTTPIVLNPTVGDNPVATGTSTYTGITTVASGTLQVESSTALGAIRSDRGNGRGQWGHARGARQRFR